jgi:hypothetical protein
VGHTAIFNSAPFEGTYESGAGVVHPLYSGGAGIFTQMVAHGMKVGAERFGLKAIFGEAVTNHVYAQRSCQGQGWISFAIEVDLMPAAAYGRDKNVKGRVSTLMYFKTLRARPHTIYLPSAYREILSFLYQTLNDTRQFLPPTGEPKGGVSTRITMQIFDFAQVARLAVHDAGRDFPEAFTKEEQSALNQGVRVIQVWLKLSWPWIDQWVGFLQARGYCLGGILPRWFDDDGLLMQRILDPPNWEGIQLYFERDQKLLELVKKDWERI